MSLNQRLHPYRRQDSELSVTPPPEPEPPLITPIPLNARAASITGTSSGIALGGSTSSSTSGSPGPSLAHFAQIPLHPRQGFSSLGGYGSAPPSPGHSNGNGNGSTPTPPAFGSILLASAPNRIVSGSPAISDADDDEHGKKARRFRPGSYPTYVSNGKATPVGGLFGDPNYTRTKKRYSRFTDTRWWTQTAVWLFRWLAFGYVLVAVAVFSGWLLLGHSSSSDVAADGSRIPAWLPFWNPSGVSLSRKDDAGDMSRRGKEDGPSDRRQKPQSRDETPPAPPPPLGPDVHPAVPRLPASVDKLPYNSASMFQHLSDTVGARTVAQKMFQFALRPFDVMPFFVKASEPFAEHAIAISTLIDPSRFKRLATLAKAYNGPLSVALHVRPEELDRQVAKLGQLVLSDPSIREKCDIHLVITPHPRQLNLLRNVARFFARTDLVIQLDADFLATTDIAGHVDELGYRDRLLSGEVALVLPAFEWAEDDPAEKMANGGVHSAAQSDPSLSDWPQNKEELLEHFGEKRLMIFHHQWAVGHGATNYSRWKNAEEPYEITEAYHHSFEPYLVMRRDYDGSGMPYCDERLVGYGGNKAACVFEGHLSGVKLFVMPDDWVIHQR